MIRVDVQLDHESGPSRFIARAYRDGKCIHEIAKYTGPPDDRDFVFRLMTEWLGTQGLPVPDHYWRQTFPHSTPPA